MQERNRKWLLFPLRVTVGFPTSVGVANHPAVFVVQALRP